jgi:aromatic ring-opening dioxygenase LigB subunit
VIHKDLFGQNEVIEKKTFLSYDNIPNETRLKVFYVIAENAYHFENEGPFSYPQREEDLDHLRYQICKHNGISKISNQYNERSAIHEWLMGCSIKDFLQTIEIFIDIRIKDSSRDWQNRLSNTITEINEIFRNDKIGYEIVSGRFIRKDSEYLHEQVIKQTINLLYTNDFKGPLVEFQKALDHYIRKEYKDTIQEANNSFESTMKSVLTKLNINFSSDDTAEMLLDRLIQKEFIYKYTKSLFIGLPVIRNKQSGHGHGIDPKEVNQSYAELALNLAGTFIVFLVTKYKEL